MCNGIALKGQTALITGAANRLGRAIAIALADQGVNVVIHHRESVEEAKETAGRVAQTGANAWTLRADLSTPEGAETLVPRAIELAGSIDILINNASVFALSQLMTFTVEEFLDNVRINALAPTLIARRFVQETQQGAIVNMLDCRITDYDAEHAAYHASKRMLFTLTRMMALEFAPNFQVNAIAPGLILPPEGKDESYLEQLASSNPLNRYGDAGEVTRAVLFLLQSRFITGQVIFLDGGRHMRGSVYG